MRVWVDCTAAAHPLVLRPLIERLEGRGHEVLVTAREYGQTEGILDRLGIEYRAVGRHGGAGAPRKALALAGRSARLLRLAGRFRPDLALAHGSVDLAVVSTLLRVPSVQMQDYEFAGLQRRIAFRLARRVLAPEAIPVERLARIGAPESKLFRYPGLKEDYYLADFVPDRSVLEALDLDPSRVIAVLRPPPETSEYHAPSSLWGRVLRRLAAADGVQVVVIPRTERQAAEARRVGEGEAEEGGGAAVAGGGAVIVPDRAIDAQSLIALADLVVSAGGTMNREAVALGTPVYTTFAGRMGGVDEGLIAEGRLRVLREPAEIVLRKREASPGPLDPRNPDLLVDAILSTRIGPSLRS